MSPALLGEVCITVFKQKIPCVLLPLAFLPKIVHLQKIDFAAVVLESTKLDALKPGVKNIYRM